MSAQFAMVTVIVPDTSLGIAVPVVTIEREGRGKLLVTDW